MDDAIEWDAIEDLEAELVADRVISQVRRRRRTRLLSVAGMTAVGAVLAAALSVPGSGSAEGPASSALAQRAEIYAAALAGGGQSRSATARTLVRDHVCAAIPGQSGTGCQDARIPAAVQRRVAELAGCAVSFVPAAATSRSPGDAVVVTFGALHVDGRRATLGVETLCGPLCSKGLTLVLTRRDGTWRVTGTTGTGWIS